MAGAGVGAGVEHAGAHASYRESVKALLEQWEESSAAGGAGSSSARAATTTMQRDPSLSLLLPLLILLSTLLFLLIFFLIFLILVKRGRLSGRGGIALGDNDGPLDLSREEELDGEGGLRGIEQRWLEQQDEGTTAGYERAKLFQQQYLPNSMATDITLSQFLSIQEKGISAWSFEPDYETNSPLFVTSRTEITFLEDGIGMAAQEGGACCVQSNLPLPRLNEVYYWEVKLFEKPNSTNLAIGLSTKPYPSFRMPGWNRYSIGYSSSDGFKSYNYPFTAQSYGPPLAEGDVLGVGYRPRTGAVFFTRNGKKLEDAYVGLTKHNLFPTVAADGAAVVHVNLGQAGFVFIEANVKKWGLAPTIGTLAPPPAYGSERGSILLESATTPRALASAAAAAADEAGPALRSATPASSSNAAGPASASTSASRPRHERQPSNEQAAAVALGQPSSSSSHLDPSHSRHRPGGSGSGSGSGHRRQPSGSTVPVRPSPLRTTMTRTRTPSSTNSTSSSSPVSIPGTASLPDDEDEDGAEGEEDEDADLLPHNPPTPGQLDISLRAMSPFSRRIALEEQEERQSQRSRGSTAPSTLTATSPPATAADMPTSSTPPYHVSIAHGAAPPRLPGDVSPPSYALLDANQYPAGVAEAMLDSLPEDQLAALFAGMSGASASAGGSASASGSGITAGPSHYTFNTPDVLRSVAWYTPARDDAAGQQQQQQQQQQQGAGASGTGLGLRGFFGSVWGRAGHSQNDENV